MLTRHFLLLLLLHVKERKQAVRGRDVRVGVRRMASGSIQAFLKSLTSFVVVRFMSRTKNHVPTESRRHLPVRWLES